MDNQLIARHISVIINWFYSTLNIICTRSSIVSS
jgi:hypothetical protein